MPLRDISVSRMVSNNFSLFFPPSYFSCHMEAMNPRKDGGAWSFGILLSILRDSSVRHKRTEVASPGGLEFMRCSTWITMRRIMSWTGNQDPPFVYRPQKRKQKWDTAVAIVFSYVLCCVQSQSIKSSFLTQVFQTFYSFPKLLWFTWGQGFFVCLFAF